MGKAVGFGVEQSASDTAGSNFPLIYPFNSHRPKLKPLVADTNRFEINIDAITDDRSIFQPSWFSTTSLSNQAYRAESSDLGNQSESRGFHGKLLLYGLTYWIGMIIFHMPNAARRHKSSEASYVDTCFAPYP